MLMGSTSFYGAVKGTSLKWVDHAALAENLLRGHRIDKIKYFTARVQSRPDNPGLSQRQNDYIRAMVAHSRVEVHYGRFTRRKRFFPLAKDITQFVGVLYTEEKGSDVSLGAHLVWDACHGLMDVALLLSNDSDLQTPVEMAEAKGVKVITVNPHHRADQPRRLHSTDKRTLKRRHLSRSQLPDPVIDQRGGRIPKPKEWM